VISYCSIVKDIHFREASVFKQHTSCLQKPALANVDELCRSAMQFVNTDPVRDSCSLMIQKRLPLVTMALKNHQTDELILNIIPTLSNFGLTRCTDEKHAIILHGKESCPHVEKILQNA
jgi:hypothetical protein